MRCFRENNSGRKGRALEGKVLLVLRRVLGRTWYLVSTTMVQRKWWRFRPWALALGLHGRTCFKYKQQVIIVQQSPLYPHSTPSETIPLVRRFYGVPHDVLAFRKPTPSSSAAAARGQRDSILLPELSRARKFDFTSFRTSRQLLN